MRIVFITPEFVTEDNFSGGLANYVYRIAKSLCEMGHDIHVFVQTKNKQEIFLYQGIFVHRIHVPLRKPWAKNLFRNFFLTVNSMLLFSFKAWRELERLHPTTPVDIVQTSNLRACGLFSTLYFNNAPVVTRMSSYVKTLNKALNYKKSFYLSLVEFIEIVQLKKSKYIYSPSQLIAETLKHEERIENIKVIRSPIYVDSKKLDDSIYSENLKEKKYLLFVGSFRIHKGIHILGQALPTVFSSIPNCQAVFVGKEVPTKDYPSMQENIKELCKRHINNLHFFDEMRHDKLYPILKNAHLVVLPSLIDNLPNTLLESMIFGKVVIATNGTSFDEIIEDGKNGFLVTPGNPNELAKKIIDAWNSPNLKEIASKAREMSNHFKPEHSANNLIRYYESIINNKINSSTLIN